MKEIFIAWFKKTYPECRSQWSHRVHKAFVGHWNAIHKVYGNNKTAHSVTRKQVAKWLNKMGVLCVDRTPKVFTEKKGRKIYDTKIN
jgi:hypothetical protein